MAAFYKILLLLSVSVAVATRKSLRTKRGLVEFAGAIRCSTGRSPFDYMFYGCYCGLGGQGLPKDQTDRCCLKHDCCYGAAASLGCEPKLSRYHWTCEDRRVECDDLENTCEKLHCKCDRDAAKCFRKAPYIEKYRFWPDCLCSHEPPQC